MSGARIRLLHVCGARPNFMKVAPVMAAVEAWNEASAGAAGPGGALGLPARSVRFQQLDDDACPWEAVCAAWPRARTLASPWATAATRRPGRTWRYPGLKEHISLAGFAPDPGYLERTGIDASRPVVVVRPPADVALYHRFASPLFPRLLERLASAPLTTILLARTGAQAADLEAAGSWPAPTPWSAPAAA